MKHKPLDFAWLKRCKEPKVHTSKALTAPQAGKGLLEVAVGGNDLRLPGVWRDRLGGLYGLPLLQRGGGEIAAMASGSIIILRTYILFYIIIYIIALKAMK